MCKKTTNRLYFNCHSVILYRLKCLPLLYRKHMLPFVRIYLKTILNRRQKAGTHKIESEPAHEDGSFSLIKYYCINNTLNSHYGNLFKKNVFVIIQVSHAYFFLFYFTQ